MAKVMRPGEFERVELEPGLDLAALIEATHADGIPRVIERNGEPLAIIAPPDDYPGVDRIPKSRRHFKQLMALAGTWSDLPVDDMIEELYANRRAAIPSPPVEP